MPRSYLVGPVLALLAASACGMLQPTASSAAVKASGVAEEPAPAPETTPTAEPNVAAPLPASPNDSALNGNNSTAGDGNFTIGPTYTKAPEFTADANVPQGKVSTFTIASTGSKFYDTATAFNRKVSLYVPAQYTAGSVAPVMVVHDGASYVGSVPTVLDNLIAAKKLPVMLAVFIDPGPDDERSVEYDTVSADYANFVEAEVLPVVASKYNVKFTSDPWGRATFGGSSGGAAAFTMAWFRPDLYRRVMTYSGSYTAIRPTADYPHGSWTYHETLIASTPNKGLRVALEVGQNDHVFDMPYRNTPQANAEMFTTLTAAGYHVRYNYALNAGHVDGNVINQTEPETLLWLWRGYPLTQP